MNPNEITASVSALAITIANQLRDDELAILSAILIQLGYTIESVVVQREVCKAHYERLNKDL